MTTIAFKDGIIAYDSLRSAGNLVISDEQDKKHIIREGVVLFACGAASDIENLVAHLQTGDKLIPNNTAGGLLVEDGVVYDLGVSHEDGVWKYVSADPWADGSGQSFALAAMDLGKSAEDAVTYAATRDTMTGGKVNTFVVDLEA